MNSYSCNVNCVSTLCQYALEYFLISHFHGLSQKKICYFSYDLFLASLYFYHCVLILFSFSEQLQEDCDIGLDIPHEASLQKAVHKTWILIIVRTVHFVFNLQHSPLHMQLRQKATKSNLAIKWHSLHCQQKSIVARKHYI